MQNVPVLKAKTYDYYWTYPYRPQPVVPGQLRPRTLGGRAPCRAPLFFFPV